MNKKIVIQIIMFIILLTSVTAGTLNEDITHYWKFEDYTDEVGNITWINAGSTTWSDAVIDNGRAFSGGGQTISISEGFGFEQGTNDTPFSVAFWVNAPDTDGNTIINSGLDAERSWRVGFRGTEKLTFEMWSGNAHYIGVDTPPITTLDGTDIFIVLTYDGSTLNTGMEISINNVNQTLDYLILGTFTGVRTPSTTHIARFYTQAVYSEINIDELSVYNRVISQEEIDFLYAERTPNSDQQYPFVTGNETLNITYNITTIQSSDITTTAVDEITFNTTISVTGNSTSLSGTANFTHYINTSLNNGCSIFENGECSFPIGITESDLMTKINETSYTITLDDTHLFPAYYPFNAEIMEDAIKTPYYIYLNNYLMWEVSNMATIDANNLFLAIEVGGDNQTDDEPLYIYYCNDSYDQNSDPNGEDSCELQQAVLSSNLPSHAHGQTTHYVIGINPSITKTQNSTFVFYTEAVNEASGWWIDYFTNINYTAKEFLTGRFNNINRDTTNIYDVHLHQSLETDSFNYYIDYYGVEADGVSNLITDTYDISNRPPNTPIINAPCNITYGIDSSSNTQIFFNWSEAIDPDNDSITYNVSIRKNGFPINLFTTSNTNYTYYLNATSDIYNDDFRTEIETCDDSDLCSTTISSCSFNLCYPDFKLIPQPCTDGVSLFIYEDDNNCNVYNDIPSINGTYQVCKTEAESENQTLFIIMIIFIILLIIWFITKNSIIGIINIFFIVLATLYVNTLNVEGVIIIGMGFIALIYTLITYLQVKNN